MTINVGIIGAGRIGRLHIENIKKYIPDFTVHAIADLEIDPKWAQSLKVPLVSNEPMEVITHPKIQAVLICTPTATHTNLIQQAAKHGKHIFCEKPLAANVNEILQIIKAVDTAGVKLQVGFNRRFDANFAKLKQDIAHGKIGQPHLLRITSRDPHLPPLEYLQQSGGIFLDMSIHDFDMARFLINSEVVEVYTQGAVLIDQQLAAVPDIDTATISLKFANGTLGIIDNSRQAVYGYDQRVEVFGTKGCVWANNNHATNTFTANELGVTSDKLQYFFLERYQQSYVEEIRAFYRCIAENVSAPVTGVDGLWPVAIGIAAQQSYQQQCVVKVDKNESERVTNSI